jgi:WD40 repeat protein
VNAWCKPGVNMPDVNISGVSMSGGEAGELGFQLCWRGDLADYVTAIAFDPTGTVLAASSAAGEVALWSLAHLSQFPLSSSHRSASHPVPVELIAFLRVGDAASVDCLAFSSDGKFLAAAGQSGRIDIWQINGPMSGPMSGPDPVPVPPLITTLANAPAWVDRLAWHPHKPQLAYALGKYVQIWDAANHAILATLNFEHSSVLDLTWHPDGTYLAIAGYQGLKIWSAAEWDADPEVLEIPSASVAIAWSPDGKYLAAGNLDRTIAVVEWGNPAPWVMRGLPGKIRHLAWSVAPGADSPRLAVASASSAVIWGQHADAAIGWVGQILGDHAAIIPALAFQPGTLHLATASADGCLCLWHGDQERIQTLNGASQGFNCLSWHPQGGYLAAGGQRGALFLWAFLWA